MILCYVTFGQELSYRLVAVGYIGDGSSINTAVLIAGARECYWREAE